MGSCVRAFEKAFAAEHGMADAVAVSSCTAGLHLALSALGIGPGDEVLVPSLSFVATANAVVYCGAKPVFVDIRSLDEPLMSVAAASARCTSRTRAVVVMHYGGCVADPRIWREFADERGIFLLEDSAHAVGAARSAIFGDAAVFSFFGNKNMTTAEGGMILSADARVLAYVRNARAHGMTTSTVERLHREATYDVTMLGFNYRMNELSAAIGMVQLKKLAGWNARRRDLTEHYRQLLDGDDIMVPFSQRSTSTHHIFVVLLPAPGQRERVMAGLRGQGIQTSFHYPPIHRLSWYRDRIGELRLPMTESFSSRALTLPLHPKMSEEQIECVVRALRSILGRRNRRSSARTVGTGYQANRLRS